MAKFVASREIVHRTREFWWCAKLKHKHRTEGAAIRCETKRGLRGAAPNGGNAR